MSGHGKKNSVQTCGFVLNQNINICPYTSTCNWSTYNFLFKRRWLWWGDFKNGQWLIVRRAISALGKRCRQWAESGLPDQFFWRENRVADNQPLAGRQPKPLTNRSLRDFCVTNNSLILGLRLTKSIIKWFAASYIILTCRIWSPVWIRPSLSAIPSASIWWEKTTRK